MKINPLQDAASAASVGAAKSERGAVSHAPKVGDTAPGVPVTVSASVRALEATSAGTGVDEAKVSAVRAAIADGTFRVSSGAVADKMLSNAQEFLSRVKG